MKRMLVTGGTVFVNRYIAEYYSNYEYYLDVSSQYELMDNVKPLDQGLIEAFDWYINNKDKVNKKPFFEYIDSTLV